MRKGLLIFLVLLFIVVIFTLTYLSFKKLSEKEDRKENISLLPSLTFSCINGRQVTLRREYNGIRIVLILFNSECDLCTYEAASIAEKINSFGTTPLLFLSTEPLEKIIEFSEAASLSLQENVLFGRADANELESVFKSVRYPNIFVYASDGSLIQEFKGETKVDLLLEALNS